MRFLPQVVSGAGLTGNAEGRMQKAEVIRRALLLSAFCLLPSAFVSCSRPAREVAKPHPKTVARAEYKEDLPARDRYAGSDACKECHEKNYSRWTHDWHARALTKATRESVAGDFGHAHFRGESSEAWFTRKDDRYFVRTRNR